MRKFSYSKKEKIFLTATFFVLAILAYIDFYLVNVQKYVGKQNIWESRRFIAFLVFVFISVLVLALNQKYKWLTRIKTKSEQVKIPPLIKVLAAGALICVPAILKWIIPFPETFQISNWVLIFLFYAFSLGCDWIFNRQNTSYPRLMRIAFYILLCGSVNLIVSKLEFVTNYPFTLYWSEGNRFFDYSTLFGSFRYLTPGGRKINAFTTWAMQLPWALPFSFPHLSIGVFRLWNQLL